MSQTADPLLPDHPINGAAVSPIKDNALQLSAIGLSTRFGADWPGKRCLAKTRRGTECQRPAITTSGRCRLHGGRSTGPRTEDVQPPFYVPVICGFTKHVSGTGGRMPRA